MAGHQSNHITIAYVDDDKLQDVLRAFVAQAITQGIKVSVAGNALNMLEPSSRVARPSRPSFG